MKKIIIQLKWIGKESRPILFLVILITVLKSIFSLLVVFSALVSKYLIDSATKGELSTMFKWIFIMGVIVLNNLSSSLIMPMLSAYTSTKLTNSLQKNMFNHITYSQWNELSKYHNYF